MIQKTWRDALSTQLDALRLVKKAMQSDSLAVKELDYNWRIDQEMLSSAIPFFWAKETTQAILEVGKTIPDEVKLDRWSLDTPFAWWYFQEPLPYKTTLTNDLIRAICFGWFEASSDKERLGTSGEGNHFFTTLWIDNKENWLPEMWSIAPSQVWCWKQDHNLSQMLLQTKWDYQRNYGPGGPWEHRPRIGEEEFMLVTLVISRLLLAGLAWLKQRVLVILEEQPERHYRKDFLRRTGKKLDSIKLVYLRRVEREEIVPSEEHPDWSCRWIVDGHWRLAAVGPGRKERRLTYVHPYIKGPEDKPLRVPEKKIFVVNK